MVSRVDQLILRGPKNRSEMALGKDRINEAWADLLELIDTRKQLLTSALAMQRFLSDTQVRGAFLLIDKRSLLHCASNIDRT